MKKKLRIGLRTDSCVEFMICFRNQIMAEDAALLVLGALIGFGLCMIGVWIVTGDLPRSRERLTKLGWFIYSYDAVAFLIFVVAATSFLNDHRYLRWAAVGTILLLFLTGLAVRRATSTKQRDPIER